MENLKEVNGLSLEDIGRLYRILVDYETSYKVFTPENFNRDYPKFKIISELLNLEKVEKTKITSSVTELELNHLLMTEGKQPVYFIKHLRNAFANSQLIKKEGWVELKDYAQKDKNKKEFFSAYGKISCDTFTKILNILTDK